MAEPAALPTGTVTFLFTDLEGSTRLWEGHPEAMRTALARHDEILRDAVGQRSGVVVKTTGDGLHAAFAVAADAVAAATDAQQVLLDEAWALPEPLRVRMGLHTGRAEIRAGDYYGPAVNRAARVSAAAHGGQVVVSHATEELVRDDLPAGAALTDLGEHRLRDLARPERVYQVDAPGLRSDFPPLRSIDAYPTNLPLQLSSFVGREREIATIAKELYDARLVTLTGVGGVGKTRLSIQVAAEVLPHYRDGVWLCELAAATDPDSLAQVVASTLGVAQRPGLDLAASILEYLRGRELLVLLDNCEHLLDAAGRLGEGVLRECAGVRILATSREGLGVEGERVVALRSLGVPEQGAGSDAAAASEAVRLFLERAHAAQAEFELDAAAVEAVGEICRRLDGIPLAIELAAARVVAMHPREIADHLDERFRLLTGGRRTAVERHHTLRATVDWSYSLLGPTEQAVFARLGVFAGSFDASAAQAVVRGDGIERFDVLDALTDLVAKSMVTADRSSGTTRYQLLETLRQYARELLDEQGASDAWRRRHAEHYVAFAEEAGSATFGPDELVWHARIVDDLDNLRAVVIWGLDRDDPADVDLALRVIAGLIAAGLWHRELGLAQWALDATARVADAAPDRRAAVRGIAASGAVQAGDLAHAEGLARAALEDRAAARPLAMGHAYTVLSLVRAHAGEFRAALDIVDGALAEMMELPESTEAPSTLTGLHSTAMYWALMGGEVERAKAEARTALELGHQAGNPSSLALGLLAFGYVGWRDDPEAALAAIEEGAQLVREGAADNALAGGLQTAALVHASRGHARDAVLQLREALRYERQVGDRVTTASILFCAVNVLGSTGFPELAATCVGIVTLGPLAGLGFHIDPEGYERGRAEAERVLGDDAFRASGARTAAMSFDEACVHVLSELDRLLELDATSAALPDA